MFQLPGGFEWLVILTIALLIFGPRLPSVMRSMGKGLSEFKKGLRETEEEIRKEPEQNQEKTPPSEPPAG